MLHFVVVVTPDLIVVMMLGFDHGPIGFVGAVFGGGGAVACYRRVPVGCWVEYYSLIFAAIISTRSRLCS